MMTKEQIANLNPKSLWIPFTEQTDWDAIDFDDMFVLMKNDKSIRLYNGRASISYGDKNHPGCLNDPNLTLFFEYQKKNNGVEVLKPNELGKKILSQDYMAMLPLNFNLLQNFKPFFAVNLDTIPLERHPLLLVYYDLGFWDVISHEQYVDYKDKDGISHSCIPESVWESNRVNNVNETATYESDFTDSFPPDAILNLEDCPLTKLFKD